MSFKDAPRCTAHRTNGQSCGNPAVRGTNVCRVHGGSAPQVKAAAQRRLAVLVDPAIDALAEALASGDVAVRLRAARDVLDRSGIKAPAEAPQFTTIDVIEAEIARLEADVNGWDRGAGEEST